MKKIQMLFLAVGIAVLVLLVREIGIEVLITNLKVVGRGIFVVILAELCIDGLNTFGWWFTFKAEDKKFRWLNLFFIRQAGSAVNQTTPSASLGGEMVKALLLRRYIPMVHGLASVITAKLSMAVAQALFVLIGLTAFLHRLALPLSLKISFIMVFLLTVMGIAVFFLLQRRGLFASTLTILNHMGLRGRLLEKAREKTAALDARIASFHLSHPRNFLLSVGFHFLSQTIAAVQVYLILRWLGVGADLFTCLAIEAFSLMIEVALFIVPGKVGVQEGGKVLILTALGFTAATGLTLGVILRINQLVSLFFGLTAFFGLQILGHPVQLSP